MRRTISNTIRSSQFEEVSPLAVDDGRDCLEADPSISVGEFASLLPANLQSTQPIPAAMRSTWPSVIPPRCVSAQVSEGSATEGMIVRSR
jgi:hypothetical protein